MIDDRRRKRFNGVALRAFDGRSQMIRRRRRARVQIVGGGIARW